MIAVVLGRVRQQPRSPFQRGAPCKPQAAHHPPPKATAGTPRRAQSAGSSTKTNSLEPMPMTLVAQPPPVQISPGDATSPTHTKTLYHSVTQPSRAARPPHTTPPSLSSSDPHTHPVSQPRAASALAVYQIAHRYGLPDLSDLALEHIMNTITPKSSFPLLLATAVWNDLHALVEVS